MSKQNTRNKKSLPSRVSAKRDDGAAMNKQVIAKGGSGCLGEGEAGRFAISQRVGEPANTCAITAPSSLHATVIHPLLLRRLTAEPR